MLLIGFIIMQNWTEAFALLGGWPQQQEYTKNLFVHMWTHIFSVAFSSLVGLFSLHKTGKKFQYKFASKGNIQIRTTLLFVSLFCLTFLLANESSNNGRERKKIVYMENIFSVDRKIKFFVDYEIVQFRIFVSGDSNFMVYFSIFFLRCS